MMVYLYGIIWLMSSYYWLKKMVNGIDVNFWMGFLMFVDMFMFSVFEGDSLECKNGWVSIEFILYVIVFENDIYVKFLIGK